MTANSTPMGTAAGQLLRTMKTSGVDIVLANAGTDFPTLIEAFADPEAADLLPTPMVVHHESVAMGMAHGHYLVSGRMLAVMVHVNVGLANCAMAALNAAASQVPVLILSGRTPATETGRHGSRVAPIHWGQEMFDQASLVREAVKWEYELRYPEQAAQSVARAISVARAAPAGPAYLSLPREVLAEPVDAGVPEAAAAEAGRALPDPELLDRAVEMIAAARNPLIVVQRTPPGGHLPGLAELAEALAIPVVEFWPTASCLPTDHPMHAGFDPAKLVGGADLVLTLGTKVPWIPGASPTQAKVVAIGPDPLELGTPFRAFPADIALAADTARTMEALSGLLIERAGSIETSARRTEQVARRTAQEQAVAAMIEAGASGPMNHAYVGRILSEEAGADAAIFSELGVPGPALRLPNPGQLFWTPLSGGLGWGLPAALGAKLAQPERTVIATVGDGSYIFANPAACHQVAALHGLPVLTVVLNNGRWHAVKRATTGMYPDGRAVRANEMPLTALGPTPDYCAMAAAHGAHAQKVEDPAVLRDAVRRALDETRAGRQALLDVVVE